MIKNGIIYKHGKSVYYTKGKQQGILYNKYRIRIIYNRTQEHANGIIYKSQRRNNYE